MFDAAGRLYLGDVARRLADQRARNRAADGDQAQFQIGFVVTNDLVADLGAAAFVFQVFGATVDLEDEDSGAKVRYQIVGDDEADLKLGLISISSPIARALIGKAAGDVAEVQAPGGIKHWEIVAVRYA